MSNKINKSAYNFIIFLKYITKHNIFEVDDILFYFENNFDIIIFRETILKYIRTAKETGINIIKTSQKKYAVYTFPTILNLSDKDKNIILKILKLNNVDISFFNKIKLFTDKPFRDCLELKINEAKKENTLVKKIQEYCAEERHLKITLKSYKNSKTFLAEPFDILFQNNKNYLNCYNITEKSNNLVLLEDIEKTTQLPTKNKFSLKKSYVTLKIKLPFATSYVLKPDEEILNKNANELLIRSFYYDKIKFYKNLLRYMDNCEIISPVELRTDFAKYIKSIIALY